MSNSSRIEAATRQHVGEVLTSTQIAELVKMSDPTNAKGVYPSDCAYKRDEAGKLIPRGKQAYGDGVLEYLGENQFKVLADKDIVRMPRSAKKAAAPAVVIPTPAAPDVKKAGKKAAGKSTSTSSKPPVIAKQKANLKAATM